MLGIERGKSYWKRITRRKTVKRWLFIGFICWRQNRTWEKPFTRDKISVWRREVCGILPKCEVFLGPPTSPVIRIRRFVVTHRPAVSRPLWPRTSLLIRMQFFSVIVSPPFKVFQVGRRASAHARASVIESHPRPSDTVRRVHACVYNLFAVTIV